MLKSIKPQVCSQVCSQVRNRVLKSVMKQTNIQVWQQVWNQIDSTAFIGIGEQIRIEIITEDLKI